MHVLVMHPTGIMLASTADPNGHGVRNGYREFRWQGHVSDEEYHATCALDDKAGRPHRLMRLDPEPNPAAPQAVETKPAEAAPKPNRRVGRPRKTE